VRVVIGAGLAAADELRRAGPECASMTLISRRAHASSPCRRVDYGHAAKLFVALRGPVEPRAVLSVARSATIEAGEEDDGSASAG
jgi:hypothetical protein